LLADNADLTEWQAWLRSAAGSDIVEYRDLGGGIYRTASFDANRIETCLFLGPADDAGDWNFVRALFATDTLNHDQRRMLLLGKPMDGVVSSGGPVVCACFGVGRTTILETIASGAGSVPEIGLQLKAGTNCGSCIPELKRLIAQQSLADHEHEKLIAVN
jgi:assimilatory nitrate reductase catalytic subunit